MVATIHMNNQKKPHVDLINSNSQSIHNKTDNNWQNTEPIQSQLNA